VVQSAADPVIILSGVPFSGVLTATVTGFTGPVEMAVLDVSGRIVACGTTDREFTWDTCGAVPAGVYVVTASGSGRTVSARTVLIR
jgi:hypothetical protein